MTLDQLQASLARDVQLIDVFDAVVSRGETISIRVDVGLEGLGDYREYWEVVLRSNPVVTFSPVYRMCDNVITTSDVVGFFFGE